jgi:hypothetical protein
VTDVDQHDTRIADAPVRRQPSPAVVAAAAVLAPVLALLAGAAVGPWDRPTLEEPEISTSVETAPPMPLPTVTITPEPEPEAEDATANTVLRWALIVVAIVVAVVLALLLARLLVALMRRREPITAAARLAVASAGADDTVDVPAMQDGIAAAQRLLAEDRPPRDAIIQAWLALEHAAASSGVARAPAQTPTEFTAVVLRRTPADHDAVETLLRLYLRVRFSEQPLLPDDAVAARGALTAIARSWDAIGSDL